MSITNRILALTSRKVIDRNKKFAGRHKGESCYVFGNGASLKYFKLKKFNDKPSIGCHALFLHQDFNDLNLKYYYTVDPFLYYPYGRNPYTKKMEKNVFGGLCKRNVYLHKNIDHFVSLADYFGIWGKNIYYVHHFSKLFLSYSDNRLDGSFTTMACALAGMLGLALFMGFKDITLVGCDYTFFPQGNGHFYDFGRFPDLTLEEPVYKILLIDALKYADVRVVTPYENYRGHILPHISYKKLTDDDPVYKENYEIVSKSDLVTLNRCGRRYKIFP